MTDVFEAKKESTLIGEAQLLLAEKRTSLATMRTGIAVFALPLSVLSVLVATSKYYDMAEAVHFLVPLMLLNLALVFLGSYLIVRAVRQLRRIDRHMIHIKASHPALKELIEP